MRKIKVCFCASLFVSPLLCLLTRNNASVCWNPAEVAVDPGENSRVFTLATNHSKKCSDANLAVNTVTLLVYKWTTVVTLEHKRGEVVKCNYTSWDYNCHPEGLEIQRRYTSKVKQCMVLWTDLPGFTANSGCGIT